MSTPLEGVRVLDLSWVMVGPVSGRYLADLGFRCIDLVDSMYRPYDDAFWQMDLVFVRQARPEFSYQQYR